jgi:hypothetical protein
MTPTAYPTCALPSPTQFGLLLRDVVRRASVGLREQAPRNHWLPASGFRSSSSLCRGSHLPRTITRAFHSWRQAQVRDVNTSQDSSASYPISRLTEFRPHRLITRTAAAQRGMNAILLRHSGVTLPENAHPADVPRLNRWSDRRSGSRARTPGADGPHSEDSTGRLGRNSGCGSYQYSGSRLYC